MNNKIFIIFLALVYLQSALSQNLDRDQQYNGYQPQRDIRHVQNDGADRLSSQPAANNPGPPEQRQYLPYQLPAQPQPSYHAITLRAPVACDPSISNVGKRSVAETVDSFPTLGQYYQSKDNSDIVLVVNGSEVSAHRFVLRAKSPKFAQLLREQPKAEKLVIDGVDNVSHFDILLKFLYTERFDQPFPESDDYMQSYEVYKLAQEFGVDGLMKKIEQSIADRIHRNNYIELYGFAQRNGMSELTRLWRDFVFRHSPAIIAEEAFMNETLDVAEQVLSALNAPQSYVLLKIQQLMAADDQLEAKRFQQLIRVDDCSVDDLAALDRLKLIDQTVLFPALMRRHQELINSCNPARAARQEPHSHGARWRPNNIYNSHQ